MPILDVVLIGLAGLSLVPVVMVLLEVVASLTYRPARNPPADMFCPPFAVLVPAHNEAKLIAGTLQTLRPQLRPIDRLLVVADNCCDETAEIARAHGAEIIARVDKTRHGKGFALEFGIEHLARGDLPAAVVFIDADCQVAPGTLATLATLAHASGRPVQGTNLSIAGIGSGLGARFSEFAVRLKNRVRPLGCRQLGLACPMTGTGMALPWDKVRLVTLGSDNVTEDLVLGLDMTLAGHPPVFCPEALVTSSFPQAETSQRTQRTRWEQGALTALGHYLPKVAWRAVVDRSPVLAALACDLLILPLALLSACLALLIGLSAGWYFLSGLAGAFALSTLSLGLLSAAILTAWWTNGRDLLSFADLVYIPAYILRKIPLYIGIALGRRIGWVRSDRD